ncbi:MAG: hypothetical protein A2268_15640 [Candidatus Raymondbacteria bacterium RifOxyA12_full_50_37]|uniref:DUF2934 domain-containing protein n=1 Tax=Candidatus Raymondbacteria bacterium RIFOXYD12_FULL_49_13 TaxID=1817890 RepID=A0A1F7FL18_UNCRA|nr:MAG: hypothetical protein A2268_15640 [Candidatus Raymondbacteria bacterium RifOxyA12_full_50_37]OGJ86124.1 MAG: hypothetical protein A2248_22240 [Candidatus Raymondbacteria bacterium RIFOXYA2_FULL_49_16]OGJ94733.1 MAG: hypothetical protein A2350_12405 [Candidatus Raymondbacteria bacterium RifOxyB12_full_50_8]OGJ96000.1 MAG: hypothetical protein A2453_05190 [Candidatus Raymondbacteria bacterium RIFOXYC2_FULL_50_21]OGK07409.1 MAG: hypothetical protein A2519_02955 [Candidatus Raymondbacteria b
MAITKSVKSAQNHQATAGVSVSVEQQYHEIRNKAEEIFRKRNGGPGDQLSDWLKAESAIKEQHHIYA